MPNPNDLPPGESQEFWDAWKSAERALKEVELATGQHCTPAANELRYAATHLLRAQHEKEGKSSTEETWKGIRHCKRAEFDCFEYACLHFLREFEKFEDLWGGYMDFVVEIIPDYIEIRTKVLDCRQHLSEVDRSENGDREKFADAARAKMQMLSAISKNIHNARPAITAKARRHQQSVRLQVLLVVFGAVLGLALAVVFKVN